MTERQKTISQKKRLIPPITFAELGSEDPRVRDAAYRKIHRPLLSVARRIIPDDVAEDIVQEVYIKVFRRLNDPEPPHGEEADGYLVVAVTNACISILRRKKKQKDILLDKPVGEGYDEINEAAPEEDNLQEIMETSIFKKMTDVLGYEKFAEIAMLDYLGFSYKDISARLGISIGTVKSNLHRGRNKVRENAAYIFGMDYADDIAERVAYQKQKKEVVLLNNS